MGRQLSSSNQLSPAPRMMYSFPARQLTIRARQLTIRALRPPELCTSVPQPNRIHQALGSMEYSNTGFAIVSYIRPDVSVRGEQMLGRKVRGVALRVQGILIRRKVAPGRGTDAMLGSYSSLRDAHTFPLEGSHPVPNPITLCARLHGGYLFWSTRVICKYYRRSLEGAEVDVTTMTCHCW